MKKIFLFLLVGIFMLSFTSAFDFDNTYEYNPISKTAYIHNCGFWLGTCFSQGEVLAEATLIWGDTRVPTGLDTHVGSFNYTPISENAQIQNLDLVNLKNGQTMTRGKQYKVLTYKEDDNFDYVCDDWDTMDNCYLVENGTKLVEEWIPLSNHKINFILGQTYTIGVLKL